MSLQRPLNAGIGGQDVQFRREWTAACEESMRCGCPVSIVDRSRTQCTAERHERNKAPQIAIPCMGPSDTLNRPSFSKSSYKKPLRHYIRDMTLGALFHRSILKLGGALYDRISVT